MYKILIIEDDEIIAKSIEKEMNNWGFVAKKVTNFQDIIPEFVEFNPQLVLLDITLPFSMGITGVAKLENFLKFQSYLYHQPQII